MKHVSGKLIFLAAMATSHLAHAALPPVSATTSQAAQAANEAATNPSPVIPMTQDAAPATDVKSSACPPPPTLMDGSYIGIQTGYTLMSARNVVTVNDALAVTSTSVHATNGWALGALLGYGKTFQRYFYLGGEIYINANTFDETYLIEAGTTIASTEFSGGPTVGISLLPGVKWTDSTLTYVRLGWNRTTLKTVQTFSGLDNINHSNISTGLVFGVGLETLITSNYSLRGEYDHMYFSSYRTQAPCDCGLRINPSANQYMLSLIYHFG